MYTPALSDSAAYRPVGSVVSSRTLPLSRLVTITLALGITAPDSSVTVPLTLPVGAWPKHNADVRTKRQKRHANLRIVEPLPKTEFSYRSRPATAPDSPSTRRAESTGKGGGGQRMNGRARTCSRIWECDISESHIWHRPPIAN